jgi:hypothetical protein
MDQGRFPLAAVLGGWSKSEGGLDVEWRDVVWFLLTTVSLLFVAIDIRTTPESPVMKWGFVLLTAYTGVVGAFLYVLGCDRLARPALAAQGFNMFDDRLRCRSMQPPGPRAAILQASQAFPLIVVDPLAHRARANA